MEFRALSFLLLPLYCVRKDKRIRPALACLYNFVTESHTARLFVDDDRARSSTSICLCTFAFLVVGACASERSILGTTSRRVCEARTEILGSTSTIMKILDFSSF